MARVGDKNLPRASLSCLASMLSNTFSAKALIMFSLEKCQFRVPELPYAAQPRSAESGGFC
jgi:hypothetical protein